MRKIITLFFGWSLSINFANAQVIHWASVQPDWVLQFSFEDATGAKDTLYYCFDDSATSGVYGDSLLGEFVIPADTSQFYATWGFSESINGTILSVAQDSLGLNLKTPISFNKGIPPLKVKYDVLKFYDLELPFEDQTPHPSGVGILHFDSPHMTVNDSCLSGLMVFISDDYGCNSNDSLLFDNWWDEDVMPRFYFQVVPWQPIIQIGLKEENDWNSLVNIFPNPVTNIITLDVLDQTEYVFIYNSSGQTVLVDKVDAGKIDISELPNGIYLVRIKEGAKCQMAKFVVAR